MILNNILFFVFRSLGVHISKVRSITLDSWDSEHLAVMAKLGNNLTNMIYEANVPENTTKITANSAR